MARSLSLWLVLPRFVDDPRITRTMRMSAQRCGHVIRLVRVDDVDDQLREWLTEAYLDAVD